MKRLQLSFAILIFTILALAVMASARSADRESISPFLDDLQPWSPSSASAVAGAKPQSATSSKVTAYTLPPEIHKKAHERSRIYFRFYLISFIYGLAVLWAILRLRLAPKYRDWAETSSSWAFVQSLVYAPLLLLTIAVLTLPTDIYQSWLERKYGISVQGWGSWSWDWVKEQLIAVVIGTIVIWLLYLVIRRSARRWWFYFWLISLPLGAFLVFLQPLVIDPMFNKFEPLQNKDAELTASLEEMVQRAGKHIPPERMFWMGAGEKTTALNAYVAGIGASKRIVVWDTTIAKMSAPQIVFVAGHEMGHFVLNHVSKGLALTALGLLAFIYLGFRCIGWVLHRWGGSWGIRGLDDWASLPALMLLLSIFSFAASPIASGFSRYFEHQADQYGLEVTHGLTPDSGQVAAQAFQILGEVDLADPDPNPAAVFLYFSHPTTSERVQFSLSYDPWSKGEQPEFVR
jgi:STE24 endopeptidase